MGRIILIGVILVLGLIFVPPLLESGADGARGAGSGAADSLTDTVKDPDKVIEGADKVIDPALEVAAPWWQKLVSQPWFWGFATCLGIAWFARRTWAGMSGFAQKTVIGFAVFIIMFLFIAFSV